MKKEAKVEYGIASVKPWSSEMYDHNELIADIVRNEVESRIIEELVVMTEAYEAYDEGNELEIQELDWNCASPELVRLQKAVTCYGFGFGYTIETVLERVYDELENAPLYRLNEMVEELDIVLEKGFVGFS